MKKLVFIMPLMAMSLLASCEGVNPQPQGGPAKVTFSEESENCTLYYEGTPYAPGNHFEIPSGVDITLTIESNDSYLPIFKENISFTDCEATFNANKQEIIINVSADSNAVIKATAITPKEKLNDYSWSEISQVSQMGLADSLFKVGDEKKVTVNSCQHRVRIIDFNKDKDKNDNNIGITFEFANSISDWNGYSIATQWNDTDKFYHATDNYLDSSIRAALTGEIQEDGHILWTQKGSTAWCRSKDFQKSVLEMLPSELTDVLVAPKKTVQCRENDVWTDKPIVNSDGEYDKLFLLSLEEIGHNDDRKGAYAYYQEPNYDKLKLLRIKKQVEETVVSYDSPHIPSYAGQVYLGDVVNYAGYNSKSDNTEGGWWWLRQPDSFYRHTAYYIGPEGDLYYHQYVFARTYDVAPAFCI